MPQEASPAGPSGPLVGRDGEMHRIDELLEGGEAAEARAAAEEALRLSEKLHRASETVIARAALVRACRVLGARDDAERHVETLRTGPAERISIKVRSVREAVLAGH